MKRKFQIILFFVILSGVHYEYFPVYAEKLTLNVPGYGMTDADAVLYAHYIAAAIYFPVGDWVWELFVEKYASRVGKFWQSMIRSPYAKFTYGEHIILLRVTTNDESSQSHVFRTGYSVDGGLMFIVHKATRIYIAYEYHSIYEDSYGLNVIKGGFIYRYKFGEKKLAE